MIKALLLVVCWLWGVYSSPHPPPMEDYQVALFDPSKYCRFTENWDEKNMEKIARGPGYKEWLFELDVDYNFPLLTNEKMGDLYDRWIVKYHQWFGDMQKADPSVYQKWAEGCIQAHMNDPVEGPLTREEVLEEFINDVDVLKRKWLRFKEEDELN